MYKAIFISPSSSSDNHSPQEPNDENKSAAIALALALAHIHTHSQPQPQPQNETPEPPKHKPVVYTFDEENSRPVVLLFVRVWAAGVDLRVLENISSCSWCGGKSHHIQGFICSRAVARITGIWW